MHAGDVVKFTDVLEAGDADARFVVLERWGDRVLVQSADPYWNDRIAPTAVYALTDVTPA